MAVTCGYVAEHGVLGNCVETGHRGRWLLRDGIGHLRLDSAAAVRVARVLGAVVVRGAGVTAADADVGDSFTVLMVFTFNILLIEFGAADFSGTGAAFGTVTQIGPIVTVLVVAGAGATAMCADLGARTIREELDALRVMGINPVQALVVPRVLAATLVAVLLSSLVITGRTGRRLLLLGVRPARHPRRVRRPA